MIPWELLDAVPIPGGGRLSLSRRGNEYSIRADGKELMNSRAHGSEEALAQRALDRLPDPAAPRILIGGLGMGYTLAAALGRLPDGAHVQVVELVAAVIDWNRGPLGHLAGHPLRDPRVLVVQDDVARIIRASPSAFDAILLDVDNGPSALATAANDGLYSAAGLEAAQAALRPGGVLAVWSAAPDRAFSQRLARAGFDVEATRVRARDGSRGAWHTIWTAVRASS